MRTQFSLQGANRVPDADPKVFHLANWNQMDPAQQMKVLRDIVDQYDRDPALVRKAIEIFRAAKVSARDYRGQVAALLAWVQRNIYYINERGERLQTPDYTLHYKHGDCDDMAILLACLCSCVRFPYRFVLSGTQRGQKIRWIEGQPVPMDAKFSHIYVCVKLHPFLQDAPKAFAEPTLKVPLGWDVIGARSNVLPEMAGISGPTVSGAAGAATGSATATEEGSGGDWREWGKRILSGVVAGVATTVASTIVLEALDLRRK